MDGYVIGELLFGWDVGGSSDEDLEVEDEGGRAGGSEGFEFFRDPGEVVWKKETRGSVRSLWGRKRGFSEEERD